MSISMVNIHSFSIKHGRHQVMMTCYNNTTGITMRTITIHRIKVITKLPNSEQSYKGKVQTHNYINRQNQSTTGKL